METIESWSARPDVRGARLADPDMGAENRRIAPFGPCPGVEFVTLEGIVQPFPLHFHDFWTIGQMVGGRRRMTCRGEVHDLGPGLRAVRLRRGARLQAFGRRAAHVPQRGRARRPVRAGVRRIARYRRRVPARRRPRLPLQSPWWCATRPFRRAWTGCTRSPGPIPRMTRSRRKKRFGPSSRRRRGIARARRPSPRPPRPPPRRTWRGRGRTSKNGSPRASLSTTSRAARACRATTSSACSPRRRASRRIATCRRCARTVLATCWRRASIRPRSPRGLGSPIRRMGRCTNRSTASPPAATERRRARR